MPKLMIRANHCRKNDGPGYKKPSLLKIYGSFARFVKTPARKLIRIFLARLV